jgi:hypothetical protein
MPHGLKVGLDFLGFRQGSKVCLWVVHHCTFSLDCGTFVQKRASRMCLFALTARLPSVVALAKWGGFEPVPQIQTSARSDSKERLLIGELRDSCLWSLRFGTSKRNEQTDRLSSFSDQPDCFTSDSSVAACTSSYTTSCNKRVLLSSQTFQQIEVPPTTQCQ